MIKIIFLLLTSFLSFSYGEDIYGSDDGDDDRIFYKETPEHILKFNIYDSQNDCKVNQFTDHFTIEYDKKCTCFDNTTVCIKKIIDSESFINTNWSKYSNDLNISKCLLENGVINECFSCKNKYLYIFDEYDNSKCEMIGIIMVVFLFLIITLLFIFLVRFIRKIMKKDRTNLGYQRINSDTRIRLYKIDE
tara:strand:+ start:1309 stop:1881 length:573 start_codon:yes stop_codon:yes gene_type:complete